MMKKSTSLCEFSNTPSVSLMKDKRGQLLGKDGQVNSAQPPAPAEKKPAPKPAAAQEEEDMFALE
jgi:hypothetical protein